MTVAGQMAKALKRIEWWSPSRMWEDETCYIIGGGPSLEGFDFTPLHDQHVIGCNDAYTLGPWVDICVFGDYGWWLIHGVERVEDHERRALVIDGDGDVKKWKPATHREHDGLLRFPGLIVSNTPLKNLVEILRDAPRVRPMWRTGKGVKKERHMLAWYDNVGASAIHLALLLGARRVVLLGYDMQRATDGRQNWHRAIKVEPPKQQNVWHNGMHRALKKDVDYAEQYRGVEILNANPDSACDAWPKVRWEEVAPC